LNFFRQLTRRTGHMRDHAVQAYHHLAQMRRKTLQSISIFYIKSGHNVKIDNVVIFDKEERWHDRDIEKAI